MSVAFAILAAVGGVFALVGTIAVAFVVWRGGGGTALDTLERANRVLETRVHELEKLRHDDQVRIAELSAKTDVTLALAPIVEWSIHHEERAQERHQATLTVLDLIAKRMGRDPEMRTRAGDA